MSREPVITVNGTLLTDAQSLTVRVALTNFINEMSENGLGDDEVGKDIAKGYIDRGREVVELMLP